jgi:hypothetical protein
MLEGLFQPMHILESSLWAWLILAAAGQRQTNQPSAAKARSSRALGGTAEAVPFPKPGTQAGSGATNM